MSDEPFDHAKFLEERRVKYGRQCKKCGQFKEIMHYYFYRGMARGNCKECQKKQCKVTDKIRLEAMGPEAVREYQRMYYSMNKEQFKEYRKKDRIKRISRREPVLAKSLARLTPEVIKEIKKKQRAKRGGRK